MLLLVCCLSSDNVFSFWTIYVCITPISQFIPHDNSQIWIWCSSSRRYIKYAQNCCPSVSHDWSSRGNPSSSPSTNSAPSLIAHPIVCFSSVPSIIHCSSKCKIMLCKIRQHLIQCTMNSTSSLDWISSHSSCKDWNRCKVAPESWVIGGSKMVSSKGLEGYEMFDPRDSRREDREEENA